MFDWNDLKVALAAYREGSISRAAEAAGLSSSTVSRRLGALEEALGQPLFVRSPDGLLPTEAGHQVHEVALEAERSAVRIEALLGGRDAPCGTVRVSVSTELLHTVVVPRWPDFSRLYPEISVELVETTGLVDLERREADVAVRVVRPRTGDNLVITKLRDTVLGLFASQSLLEHRGVDPGDGTALRRVAASAWADWPWIDWAERAHRSIAKLRARLYPDARVVLRAANLETMRLAAAAGVGLLLLPSYFGRVTPRLLHLPAPELPGPRPVYLVGHAATRNTARVDAVWSYLIELLRGDDDRDIERGRASLTAAYGMHYEEAEPCPA